MRFRMRSKVRGVDEHGGGVEGYELDEDALGARGGGIGEAGIEEALYKVRATGASKLMDGEEEEEPLGMEAEEVGGSSGVEVLGDAVVVGLGMDGG